MKKQITAAVLALSGLAGCSSSDTVSDASVKDFTVEVVHADGDMSAYHYSTDVDNLGDFLVEEGLISGDDSSYGLYVTTVDGEMADYDADGSWWQISENGEAASTGVDGITITDGDTYTFSYEK